MKKLAKITRAKLGLGGCQGNEFEESGTKMISWRILEEVI